MNKKVLVLILVIFISVVAGGMYLLTNTPEVADEPRASQQQITDATESNPAVGANKGMYITYSENTLSETSGTRVLFFHAPWCPQCRSIENDINKQGVPQNVTIIKVDYDTNQALRQKYGVTLQTTFVKIDDSGNLVEKFVAYDNPTFESVIENIL